MVSGGTQNSCFVLFWTHKSDVPVFQYVDARIKTQTQYCSLQTLTCYPLLITIHLFQYKKVWKNDYIEAICTECTYTYKDWSNLNLEYQQWD